MSSEKETDKQRKNREKRLRAHQAKNEKKSSIRADILAKIADLHKREQEMLNAGGGFQHMVELSVNRDKVSDLRRQLDKLKGK